MDLNGLSCHILTTTHLATNIRDKFAVEIFLIQWTGFPPKVPRQDLCKSHSYGEHKGSPTKHMKANKGNWWSFEVVWWLHQGDTPDLLRTRDQFLSSLVPWSGPHQIRIIT